VYWSNSASSNTVVVQQQYIPQYLHNTVVIHQQRLEPIEQSEAIQHANIIVDL
jgi:hypothetical protein